MQKQTTGATVSRLAVLTVLVANEIRENHLPSDERDARATEMASILSRPEAGKVLYRSAERCAAAVMN